jgi:hypothetical protein
MNVSAMQTLLEKNYAKGLQPIERELVAWLDAHSPRPAVITTRSFALSAFSRSGYHWIVCDSDPRQTMRLLHDAGADYVVVFRKERPCNFVKGLLPRHLGIEKIFGDNQIYVLAPYDAAPASPPAGAAAAEDGRKTR